MFELSRHPNASLIGQADARVRLATPALLVDLPALERNIAAMAAFVAARGRGVRPHFKTHKSVEIARRQVAAGARGICCATIAEAEVLARAGISGILLCTPVATVQRLRRLEALLAAGADLTVTADNPAIAPALAEIGGRLGRPVPVLVDYALGNQRTGVADAAHAFALAGDLTAHDGIRFRGVQAYAGPLQHVATYEEREAQGLKLHAELKAVVDGLAERGLKCELVTGGGTGSHYIDTLADSPFTEIQAGSYIFMDVDYDRCRLRPGSNAQPFEPALFVRATVITANHPDVATTDAGLKRFATDGPVPRLYRGAPEGATYRPWGDEFGRIDLPKGAQPLAVGDAVECLTPHCDPTVNLYDEFHVMDGDKLVALWPVDARGLI